jgi:hypothetical protein
MNRWMRLLFPGLAIVAASLLAGCASGYLLENNVQSFSNLTAIPAPATYRFERLPSQQVPQQAQLETFADAALHKAGLQRNDANPHFSVQLGARLERVLSPWASPWDEWGWGWGGFRHHRFGRPFGTTESPWYHREVSVIVRELPSSRVVFETHAVNDGPWFDNPAVFPAMFEAAMAGFPNPPASMRQVDVQIPG